MTKSRLHYRIHPCQTFFGDAYYYYPKRAKNVFARAGNLTISFRLTVREEERSWERINATNPVHAGSDVKAFHQSCPTWHNFVTSQHPERGSLSGAVNSQKTKTLTNGDTQTQTIHCNQWSTTWESNTGFRLSHHNISVCCHRLFLLAFMSVISVTVIFC